MIETEVFTRDQLAAAIAGVSPDEGTVIVFIHPTGARTRYTFPATWGEAWRRQTALLGEGYYSQPDKDRGYGPYAAAQKEAQKRNAQGVVAAHAARIKAILSALKKTPARAWR